MSADEIQPQKKGLPRWMLIMLIAALIVAAGLLGIRFWLASGPQQHFTDGLQALSDGDVEAARRELGALEQAAGYEPQRHFLAGAILLQERKFEPALAEFDQSSSHDELHLSSLSLGGQALYQMGRIDEAEQRWNDVLREDPSAEDARLWLERSRAARNLDQAFQAAMAAVAAQDTAALGRAIAELEKSPDYAAHVHFLKGTLLLHQQQFRAAYDEFSHSIQNPQLRLLSLTLAGQSLYRLGQFYDAEQMFLEAVNTDDTAIEAHRWLADWYYQQGAFGRAAPHLRRIAELDPSDGSPARRLGLINVVDEDYDSAIRNYRDALRRGLPRQVQIPVLLEFADCLIRKQQYEDALTTLGDNALQNLGDSPFEVKRLVFIAACRYGLNDLPQARVLLDQAFAKAPDDRDALLLQAEMTQADGDAGAAVKALTRAAEVDPGSDTVQLKLADAYQQQGNQELAAKHRQLADELKERRRNFSKLIDQAFAHPDDPDVRCKLGILGLQMGRPDLASVWFQSALAIDPNHAETLRVIKQLQQPSP